MKIRKQVYDLTLADFERFPVWKFASDEEREEGYVDRKYSVIASGTVHDHKWAAG